MLLLRILFTCKLIWNIYAKFKKSQPPYSQDIFPIAQSSISVRGGSMVSKSVDLKEVLSGISWHYWVQTPHCAEYIVHLSNIHIGSSSLQRQGCHHGAKNSKHVSKKFSKPLLDQKNETSKMYPEIVKVLHTYI